MVLLWAVPYVSAVLTSWAPRSRESLGRTPSRTGRRWQAVAGRRRRRWAARRWRAGFCDPSATSSAVLFRSSWVVPLLQFLVRVDSVLDGVLLVLPTVVHRDRCPQCFLFGGRRCWERGCSMEACERIPHFFYVLALFAWNLDHISLNPLFWQPLTLVRCDSPRMLVDEFQSTLLLEEFHIFSPCWLSRLPCAVGT